MNDTCVGDFTNNLTSTDTLDRNGNTLWLGGSYTGNPRTKNETGPTYLYGTALCNYTTNGGKANRVIIQGTDRTKQLKPVDAFAAKFLLDSTGTYNSNGQTTTIDSMAGIYDSIALDGAFTVPYLRVGTTAKLNIKTGAKLTVTDSAIIKLSFGLADTSYFNRLRPDSGITITLPASLGVKVGTYAAPYKLNGVSGNQVTVNSSTPGTRARLWLPSSDTLRYVTIKDCSTSVKMYLDSTTGISQGNNRNVYSLSVGTTTKNKISGAIGDTVRFVGRGMVGITARLGDTTLTAGVVDYNNAWAIVAGSSDVLWIKNSDLDSVDIGEFVVSTPSTSRKRRGFGAFDLRIPCW